MATMTKLTTFEKLRRPCTVASGKPMGMSFMAIYTATVEYRNPHDRSEILEYTIVNVEYECWGKEVVQFSRTDGSLYSMSRELVISTHLEVQNK